MGKSHSDHWFIKEELKWRSVASAFWTFMMTFPVLAASVFVFTIHPVRHIFMFFDFISIASTIKTWVIFPFIAFFASMLVCLHFKCFKVSPIFPVHRFGIFTKVLKPNNLIHIFINGGFSTLVAHLFTKIVPGRYSGIYNQCSDENENLKLCINEFWFIFVFFGFVVGVTNSIILISCQKNTLTFLHVQEARFLFIKCKLPCIITMSAATSWEYFRHFVVGYYLVGFVARDLVAVFLGLVANKEYLLSVWTIYQIIPVAWNLWLLGTFLLLIWELSWQLFNIYNTQDYPFMFDSVFPEDQNKLLLDNLNESNPPAVQNLAFQSLSIAVKRNASKRQQIFQLSHKTENGRPIWWNKVVENCLPRIQHLTESIIEYQTSQDQWQSNRKVSSTSSEHSNESGITSPASVSVFKRRDFNASSYQADATNISYFNVSSLNDTHSTSRIQNVSTLAVPTPRLWTSPTKVGKDDTLTQTSFVPAPFQVGVFQKRWGYFMQNLKTLSIVQYFFKPIPTRQLRNLYREHFIYKCAMQILSYLCAASVLEDKFGIVQGHLHEIISSLIELLVASEKLGKVSPSSTYVYKLHVGLRNEIKASLHRITDAYGESLKSVNLSQEHRRRLEGFCSYAE
uniref:nucleoporin NDC1-like n=1 Tax=Styela clava TaxID=7725 RepID=UPI001939D322|nr:nucleoporin NDC1-like [Styela clava]